MAEGDHDGGEVPTNRLLRRDLVRHRREAGVAAPTAVAACYPAADQLFVSGGSSGHGLGRKVGGGFIFFYLLFFGVPYVLHISGYTIYKCCKVIFACYSLQWFGTIQECKSCVCP